MLTTAHIIYKLKKFLPIPVLLAGLICTFYWSLISGRVYPTGDGAIPLSFYTYLYSGYLTYGKIVLWNPFVMGGGIDNFLSYVYMGYSPFNPVVQFWLPISKFFRIPVLESYYLYFLIHIFIGSLFAYASGIVHLFKQKLPALVFSILIAISGFYVSMFGLMYFIVPYSWFLITLYFGLSAFKDRAIINYVFFAAASSILVVNGPTVLLPIIVYLILFLIIYSILESKTTLYEILLLNKKGMVVWFATFILFAFPSYLHFFEFSKHFGYHAQADPTVFFVGKQEPLEDSLTPSEIQIILNIFLPNIELGTWANYGNQGYWYNGFYYLGCLSPLFIMLGVLYLSHRKDRYKQIITPIFVTFIFLTVYTLGHPFLKNLHPYISFFVKYPKFGFPLVIFNFALLVGFGIHSLFDPESSEKSKKVFFKYIPLLLVASGAIFLVLKLSDPMLFNTNDKYMVSSVVQSYIYMVVMAGLYTFCMLFESRRMFVSILVLDLFFFLSASTPTILFPNKDVKSDYLKLQINGVSQLIMPNSIDYSMPYKYPGMHFSVGPVLFRHASVPKIWASMLSLRRAVFGESMLNDTFNDDKERFRMLSILGVSRSRYFLADSVLVVQDYRDIFSSLKNVYTQVEKINNNNQFFVQEPVVLSENEPGVISSKNYPKLQGVQIYENVESYAQTFIKYTDWETLTLPYANFKTVKNDLYGYELIKTQVNIPATMGVITESNYAEKLCVVLQDAEGNSYFPVIGDIFNFLPERADSNTVHAAEFYRFFSTYAEDGKTVLFIRRPISIITSQFYFKYSKNCSNNKVVSFEEKELLIPKRSLVSWGGVDSDFYTTYATNLPVKNQVPTYLGEYLSRTKVVRMADGEELNSLKQLGNKKPEMYALSSGVLQIWKEMRVDPYLKSDYKLEYSVVKQTPEDSSQLKVLYESPDKIELDVNKQFNDSILVTRNIYSPYWKIKIDGKRAYPIPINGIYLGVSVPSGEHKVLLEFKPNHLFWGLKVVPFGYIALAIFGLYTLSMPKIGYIQTSDFYRVFQNLIKKGKK